MFFFLEQRDKISCEGLTEGCLRLRKRKGVEANSRGKRRRLGRASLGLFIPHPFLWILGLCTFHDSFPSFSSWSRKATSEWPWQFCLGEGGGADPCHRRAVYPGLVQLLVSGQPPASSCVPVRNDSAAFLSREAVAGGAASWVEGA